MVPIDDSLAVGLARYVQDFLPTPCHGVTTVRVGPTGEAVLGVFGKPAAGDRAVYELLLYEDLLWDEAIEVVGSGLAEGGGTWAVLVRPGRMVHPLSGLLSELLDQVVQPPAAGGARLSRQSKTRVSQWEEWLASLRR